MEDSILMKDKTGYGPVQEGEEPWTVKVFKGELIVLIPEEEMRQMSRIKGVTPNHRLHRDPQVILYAGPTDVTPLDDKEIEYLLAINPPSVRLKEYLNEMDKKMKMDLVVGDKVIFKLEIAPTAQVNGIIHHIGPHPDSDGIFFGIEIEARDQAYRGKGTSNGRPYFTCGPNNAVYVAMDKIIKKQGVPDRSRVFLPEQMVLTVNEYRMQQQKDAAAKSQQDRKEFKQDDATEDEKKLAKEFGMSVAEYRLRQRAYVAAKQGKDDGKVHVADDPKIGDESNEEQKAAGGRMMGGDQSRGDHLTNTIQAMKFAGPEAVSEERIEEERIAFEKIKLQQRLQDNHEQQHGDYQVIEGGIEESIVEDNYVHTIDESIGFQHYHYDHNRDHHIPGHQDHRHFDYGDSNHDQQGHDYYNRDNQDCNYGQQGYDHNHHGYNRSHQDWGPRDLPGRHDHYDPSQCPPDPSYPRDPHQGLPPSLPPDPHYQFTIGSMVRIDTQKGDPLYGVVQWIGTVPDFPGKIAGVELDKTLRDGADGTWKGRRFFTCPPGKGYFCPVTALKQDTTFMDEGQVPAHMRQDFDNPLAKYAPVTEEIDIIGSPELFNQYIGDGPRGIQGHHNSCCRDSTVFGLFALSDSFDDLLLEEPTEEVGRKVKHFLWKGIVNPLRKYGLARYESVMGLRDSLEEFGRMKGAKTDEKDPEEFLNLLFKEVLHIPPFLTIKRPFGVEKEFFIQLFFEIDPNNTEIPKTEKLIAQMFHEQNISFTRVPSKLLLQMPRFGKEFKMYSKIIPSLTLDVKPLMDPSTRGDQKCRFCLSSLVSSVCYNCPKDLFNNTDPYIYCCSECDERVHREKERKDHRVEAVNIRPGTSDATNFSKMELLSVICIETSHYVCYTRSGDKWLFHDSMADRLYDMYNVPRVVDVTGGLQDWIYSPTASEDRLMNTPARDIPEYVRRFTQDIYMCVYVNTDLDMYGFDFDDDPTFHAFPSPTPASVKESRSLTKRELDHTNEEFHQLKKSYEDLVTSYENKTEEYRQLQDTHENLRRNYERKEDDCYQLQKSCDALVTSNEDKEERIRCYKLLVKKMEADQASKKSELDRLEKSWKISSADIEYTKTKLGRGGWAKVTIGKFRGKDVAVKKFYKVLLEQKEQSSHYMDLLHREINTMSQLRHPNLLQFIGAVLDHPSGNPMIITEVMDTSLRSAYERKELTTDPGCRPVILSIMRDVAVGLNYLHCLPDPIIHRDVSSANVLLESKGDNKWKTKISDFGSAKFARAAFTEAPGAAVYSAPESHAPDGKRQTPKMDSYSYGVLLCEVITCRFPETEGIFETLLLQVKVSSPQLHELIVLCINKEPDKRPTMSEIIVQLDRFIANK